MQSPNVPQWIPLRTRILACVFETDTGYLRPVKIGGVEVLRAIYGAVRDRNWDTVLPVIELERVEQGEDNFCLEFTARCERAPISFWWKGMIRAQGESLEFGFKGQARSTFLRNRIGLCILHPIKECPGKPCRIQHTDGTWEDGEFPFYISPHQPFKDLHALSWSPSHGISAEISFEGDIFETEDQRNWTDASYKTYSTPLEQPFPVEVASGEQISQRVALSLTMPDKNTAAVAEEPRLTLTVSSTPPARPLAKIGLGTASHGLPLSEIERRCLARLRLNHLRVDLYLARPDWKRTLKQAHDDAIAIGSRLQCAFFLNDSPEQSLSEFGRTISPDAVDLCLIFHENEKSTSSHSLELAERHLAPQGFRLATGTNAYFAELNRQRPPRGVTVCYSLNPQVHTFDVLSLLETLEAQPATVESAAQFCDKGIVISPITLRPRFNPNATTSAQESQGRLPSAVDPRQRTLFTAAWTIGTLSRLLPLERVESLTFFETTGWQGVLERAAGSQNPVEFSSTPGEIFPVYYVFEALGGARRLLPVSVSDSQRIAALAFVEEGNRSTCLLTNLTRRSQNVDIGHPFSGFSVAMIDETHLPVSLESTAPAWCSVPITPGQTSLTLSPMALAKLTFT